MTESSQAIKAQDLPAAQAALHAIETDWTAAGINWNAQALSDVYTDDAIFFGGRPGMSSGKAAVKDYFTSYVGVLKSTTMKLYDQYVIELAEDTFLAQGFAEFNFILTNGNPAKSVSRTTLLIVKRQGQWKVQQHHFSASPETPPIGTD